MLKACPYCGRIHDKKYDCGKRPTFGRYQQQDAFRSTQAWQRKRAWIRERDMHLCHRRSYPPGPGGINFESAPTPTGHPER